ncbi:MAG: hypothetical protein KGH99_02095 [Thaumarchaeota archaeon]|nr:hypothetical protein [Nitrososphaerota archaeon]MDE1872250.1 hypothetical protein [Nitrososphaerota archaeon]
MSSKLSLDDMWQVIEEYGIDRKLLETTQPSDELLFRLYTSIKQVKEKSDLFEKESLEFLRSGSLE